MNAYFKVRKGNAPMAFIAWASTTPLTDGLGPAQDLAEPLWFDFGRTEEEAVSRVKRSVQAEVNERIEWNRQLA